ncbi:MAG: glycosyltransferase family 4 protein [Limisphaerales bacterium]
MKQSANIVVIATAWGSRLGGINSFSTDLCTALSRVLSEHKVICVCVSGSESECKEAEAVGVTLLTLNLDPNGTAKREWASQVVALFSKNDLASIGWWIGHDAVTGELALACAREYSDSKCAVVMHMSYDDYSYVKHAPNEANIVAERAGFQRSIMQSADMAFAVGPLLFQRLQEMRGKKLSSAMLVPGLSEPAPLTQTTQRLHAITFGRFESAEFFTKQAPLAVAAFARSVRAGFDSRNSILTDSHLRIIGAPPDVIANLRSLAERESGRVVNLQAEDFVDDRYRLRKLLHDCNLCLMLSWHEGFGLSAWEAIGSGIPVIISRNSGAFRLLDAIGGSAVGCILPVDIRGRGDGQPNEDDTESTKRAILEVASDISKALANAKSLRQILRFEFNFTWDRTARELAQAIGLPILVTMLDHNPAVDRRKLAEPSDVTEGVEIAAAQRVLRLAESKYFSGEYTEALKVLELLKSTGQSFRSFSTAMDATLVEAEICLRLNRYTRARTLIEKVASEAAARFDWQRYIRARSVENAILRDQGRYEDAAELAENLLEVAKHEGVTGSVEKLHRLISRSLAFTSRWDEAIRHGMAALDSAKSRRDGEAEAKAALALGEVYRHGLNQPMAIKWYTDSRDLAGRSGNVDCFLWAVLGLSDSLFLLDDTSSSSDAVERLRTYVDKHVHPLESLHIRLSLSSIECRRGQNVIMELEQLVSEYNDFGIQWPRQYVDCLKAGDFSRPKRF